MTYTLVIYRPSNIEWACGCIEDYSDSCMELFVTESPQKAKDELVLSILDNLHHTRRESKRYNSAVDYLEPRFGIDGFFGFDEFNDCPPRLGSVLYARDAYIKSFIKEAEEEAAAKFEEQIAEQRAEEEERKRLATLEIQDAKEAEERELLRQLKEKYEK